jgi:hypothetical protein
VRAYLKNIQQKKMAGEMAYVVKCLATKCEALSSNPSTTHTHTHIHTNIEQERKRTWDLNNIFEVK